MVASYQNPPSVVDDESQDMKKNKESEQSIQRKKQMGHEIEEIFRNKKKRKGSSGVDGESSSKEKQGRRKEESKVEKTKKNENKEKEKKKNKKGVIQGEFLETRSKRRRTSDGLAIYSEEELGVGNPEAGGTPLCPFDCSCCF